MRTRTFMWNVPVCETYDAFVRQIQQRVARRVMSRTPGPNGQPVRREIALTQDNGSLHQTWIDLRMERAPVGLVRAIFHERDGRVERIMFTAVPVAVLTPDRPRRPDPPPARREPGSTPAPSPVPPRRSLGTEQEDEIAGVPSIWRGGRYGRYFYGVHTTQHNTICWGEYDNDHDVCRGHETRNTRGLFLHYDRGRRDYLATTRHNRMLVEVSRYRNGARLGASDADRVYRQGVLDMRREMGHTAPLPF